jgi:hypothetical protein
MQIRIPILLLLILSVSPTLALELQTSTELSTSGTFDLRWTGAQGERFRLLELNDDVSPRLVYQGRDTARVMTGLPDGSYRYQVKGESSTSQPVNVTVTHHSLNRAFGFFGVGLIVFVATLWLVVRGERGQ